MPGREISSISETEAILSYGGRGNGVTNSDTIDLQNTDAILFIIISKFIVDGTHTITFEESDDVGFSSPVAVPESDLRGATFADLVFTGPDDGILKSVSVVNNKRFLRLVLTGAGVTSNGVIGAAVIKQRLSSAPSV